MRWYHASLAVLLPMEVSRVAFAQAVQASTYPVSALRFTIDQLTFSEGPVALVSNTLQFSSNLIRTETAATIEVTLPADILFDFDKSEIRTDAHRSLHELAELLRKNAAGPVTIRGYTDALGEDAYNQRLSDRRAAAVKVWLSTREGLASTRFMASGLGARNPVAPNRNPDGSDNPEGRQMNRRVTLIIRK